MSSSYSSWSAVISCSHTSQRWPLPLPAKYFCGDSGGSGSVPERILSATSVAKSVAIKRLRKIGHGLHIGQSSRARGGREYGTNRPRVAIGGLGSVWLVVVRSRIVVRRSAAEPSPECASQHSNVSKVSAGRSLFAGARPQCSSHLAILIRSMIPRLLGRQGLGLWGHTALLRPRCHRPGRRCVGDFKTCPERARCRP